MRRQTTLKERWVGAYCLKTADERGARVTVVPSAERVTVEEVVMAIRPAEVPSTRRVAPLMEEGRGKVWGVVSALWKVR